MEFFDKYLSGFELLTPYLRDIVDIALVSYLVYYLYKLFRSTRAIPVIFGLVVLMVISIISRLLQLETLSWLFETLSTYLVITVIIILQPELRRIFYSIGQTRWTRGLFVQGGNLSEEILQAVISLSEEKTGALIVLERNVGLRQIMEGGIQLYSRISRELLSSIFYPGNPLHDGAVIISGNQIVSAATYLPLSNSSALRKTHGARHRAGLGISEESDAFSIIVSEEKKGRISACFQGTLAENLEQTTLKSLLNAVNTGRLDEEWKLLVLDSSGRRR